VSAGDFEVQSMSLHSYSRDWACKSRRRCFYPDQVCEKGDVENESKGV